MNFLPISLGVRRESDAEAVGEKPPSKSQVEKILSQDRYTCRFCGFQSQQYQRVVAFADERGRSSLVTACTFCEQCLYLERAGTTGVGSLIWLPEIGQAELNHIARAIYVALASKDKLAGDAARALEALTARKAEAKKRLGSDDPLVLATALHESLSDEEYAQVPEKLDGVRLLPSDKHMARTDKGSTDQFPAMVKYWSSQKGPFSDLPVGKWADLLKTATSAGGSA